MVFSTTLKTDQLTAQLPDASGYLIAFSGGADSSALLHLFKNCRNVRAIHINHGIHAEADGWQIHCQRICDQLSVPLIIEKATLKDHSENSCRTARYEFFAQHLKKRELLLTAHHADDQVETVLLKLVRGTGIKGLTGIKKLTQFASGHIARPLLECHAEQLKHYLIEQQLPWIEDHSNHDRRYKRNVIRHDIVPLLQQQFNQASDNIVRSANNCHDTLRLLQHLADFNDHTLNIDTCKKLPTDLQTSLLYQWLSHKNVPTPDKKTLKQITHDFIHAKKDRHPSYKNRYYQLIRWRNAIHCIKNFTPIDNSVNYTWQTNKDFTLPNGCGVIHYQGSENIELKIKFAQTGQKITTHKHQFSKTIKQLFQDHNTPPWQKNTTPFIYHNNKLVSLGHNWSHNKSFTNKITLTLINFYDT